LALFAPHAAVEQFSRAIESSEHLVQSPTPELYRLRGLAHDTLGNFDQAREDYQASLQEARTVGDQKATWRVLIDLGLPWASRDYERTGDYCRQALELARAMEDEAAVGHSLNRLGNWLMNSGQAFEALDYHHEALDLFEAINNRAGIAETLDLLAMTSNQSGDPVGTVTYYERAIPILRELHNWQTLSSSLANLTLYTMSLEQGNEAIKLAREIGWHSGEAYALNCLSMALFSRGRYGESLNVRTRSLKLTQAIEHAQWTAANHIYFGYYYIELLALNRANNHLTEGLGLAKQIGSTFFSWMGSGWLASVNILQGQLEAAETLLADLPQVWIPTLFSVRLAWVELALARQDPNRMLQLLDELLSMLTVTEIPTGMIPFFGPALALQSQALFLLGRSDEAERVFLQAIDMLTQRA
jgi:tetratricopeptide (TPR) repeat protein